MKKLTLLLISASFIFVGCAKRQYVPTQGEINKSNTIARVNTAQANIKSCQASLRGQQQDSKTLSAFEIVDKQVLFQQDDSPNKLELMASTAKINEKQRIALLDVIAASQKCNNNMKADLQNFPTLVAVYENYYGDLDIVYAQLLSKKISIGDANTQKAQLLSKSKTAYSSAIANLEGQFNSAINQELQARQAEDMQRRAIAAQYLMNQQNINAQQQMNSRPVNTICNRWGNQVNCTTQ